MKFISCVEEASSLPGTLKGFDEGDRDGALKEDEREVIERFGNANER